MAVCIRCQRSLTSDEIAVTKKLIHRGATEWYCVDCLADYFEVSPQAIRDRITYFRQMGCTLFQETDDMQEGTAM